MCAAAGVTYACMHGMNAYMCTMQARIETDNERIKHRGTVTWTGRIRHTETQARRNSDTKNTLPENMVLPECVSRHQANMNGRSIRPFTSHMRAFSLDRRVIACHMYVSKTPFAV